MRMTIEAIASKADCTEWPLKNEVSYQKCTVELKLKLSQSIELRGWKNDLPHKGRFPYKLSW